MRAYTHETRAHIHINNMVTALNISGITRFDRLRTCPSNVPSGKISLFRCEALPNGTTLPLLNTGIPYRKVPRFVAKYSEVYGKLF